MLFYTKEVKNMKRVKRLVALMLSFTMVFAFSTTAFASEPNMVIPDEREYLIVNGTDIVYVGEDYENPDTGEYVYWNESRGVDKSFSFKIRYSVTSSKFTVHSDKVRVSADAEVEDLNGNIVNGYDGHLYTVSIVGWYSRNLQFSVGSKQSGTISGLDKRGSYKVTITNNDYLTDTRYLVGSGTVSTL